VPIVCPFNGFVVAIANGGLEQQAVTNEEAASTIGVSVTRDTTSFDPSHELTVFGFPVRGFYGVTVSIQRVDRCIAGSSHRYRFLVTRGANAEIAFVHQPSLILMFFIDPRF